MRIASIAAGLVLMAGIAAPASADAQGRGHAYGHYKHFQPFRGYGYHRHAYYGTRFGYGPRYRGRYGYGYRRGRLVCRYRFGERRCFRVY